MKRILCVLILCSIVFSLCACGSGKMLNGTYVGVDDQDRVVFKPDGTCTVSGDGLYYDGIYSKTNSGWQIEIHALGIFSAIYTAKKSGNDLIISDGDGWSQRYIKQ